MSEHGELQDAARRALEGAGVAAGEDKSWSLAVELGWLLVATPEELGGLGLGLSGASAIYTELGRSLASAPYLPAMLALEAVAQSGAGEGASLVERFAYGDLATATLAVATISAKAGRLNGVATAVQAADKAEVMLVCADGLVALAPLKQAGVEIVVRNTWDKTRRLFDVRLNNAEPGIVLADGAKARALVEKVSTHRDFALAAECVGASEALLAMTVEYLKTRKQFARPLAMFQALKHRCADLKAHVSAAEALLADSLARVEAGAGDAPLLGRMAKQLASSVFFKVAEEAIQLHGGIAMTAEHACHLYVKRALLNQHLGAAPDRDEQAIAASIFDR